MEPRKRRDGIKERPTHQTTQLESFTLKRRKEKERREEADGYGWKIRNPCACRYLLGHSARGDNKL